MHILVLRCHLTYILPRTELSKLKTTPTDDELKVELAETAAAVCLNPPTRSIPLIAD